MLLAKPEARVGLFAIVAVIAMLSLFMWLNGSELLQQGSKVEAVFERVDGLRPGAPVKYIGVDVGRISKIYFEDQKVIVVIHLQPNFEVPPMTKATISSAGVVGDKFLELQPLKPGETGRNDNRIKGESPVSLDDFYASAFEVLTSIKEIVNSLNQFVGDPEVANSIKSTLARVDRIAASLERITVAGEPQIQELLINMNSASLKLVQASTTANRLLSQFENDGKTTADILETLENIKRISVNLDKFSQIIASKEPEMDMLIADAHQTMQSINQAAQAVDKAVRGLGEGGSLGELTETLNQAGQAAQKVENYVNKLEQITFSSSLGAGYEYMGSENFIVDYSLNVNLNQKDSIIFKYEDIGRGNLGTLQWGIKYQNYIGRAGIYRNDFGLGIDYLLSPTLSLGIDLWDTESPNLGLTSNWQLNEDLSMTISGSTNLDTNDKYWSFEWWRQL